MTAETDIYEYDHWTNRRQRILFYGIAAVILGALAVYMLTDIDLGFLGYAASHVSATVSSASLLGIFYLSSIGGLFVFTFPMEAVFFQGLAVNNSLVVLAVMLVGVAVSYAVNYFVGWYLGSVIRPLIGTKSFFSWKARLNQYGSWIVIVVNIIPMISQSFTAILGVFHYDVKRTALYTAIGQVIKFGGIVVVAELI